MSEEPQGGESSAATSEDPAMSVSAATRAEALALLQNVAACYRSAEPSSPIPLLLERAAGMVDRDFLSLLKDLMPTLLSLEG
jgi:type VI secretion system protein ImpA